MAVASTTARERLGFQPEETPAWVAETTSSSPSGAGKLSFHRDQKLSSTCSEYRNVSSMVLESVEDAENIEITRNQHPIQWDQYAHTRDCLIKPMNGGDPHETRLFHGTGRSLNPDALLGSKSGRGLDHRYSNGGFYGQGIYLSERAGYVLHYAFRERSATDAEVFVILLVRAALGHPCDMGASVTAETRQMRVPGIQKCGTPYGCVTGGPHRPFAAGSASVVAGEASCNDRRGMDESRIYALYDPNQCYIEYVIRFERRKQREVTPTSLPQGLALVRGDDVYFSSYSKPYPNGDHAIFGSKGTVRSTGQHTHPGYIRVQLHTNRFPILLPLSHVSTTKPLVSFNLLGAPCAVGTMVYYRGICKRLTYMSGERIELRYGDACTIAGFALCGTTHLGRERHTTNPKLVPWDRDVAAVQFPWNSAPVVIPCASLGWEKPSPILQGNFSVGECVYYTGSFNIWLSTMIDYGVSGIVVGPARRHSYVMVKFFWQSDCLELSIADLSYERPPPLLHGLFRVGQTVIYGGPSITYRKRVVPTSATSLDEAYVEYSSLVDSMNGGNALSRALSLFGGAGDMYDLQLILLKGSKGIVLAPDVLDPRKRGLKRPRQCPTSIATPSTGPGTVPRTTNEGGADTGSIVGFTPSTVTGPSVLVLFYHPDYLSCIFCSAASITPER